MPIASWGSGTPGAGQLLLAAYDSSSFLDGPTKVGVRLRNGARMHGTDPSKRSVTVRLERIPYDDSTALEAPVPAAQCSLPVGDDGEVVFSVEKPRAYGVYALSLQG